MRASYVLRAEAALADLATPPRDELERALRALSASLRSREDIPTDVSRRVNSAAKAIWWQRQHEGER